MTRKLQLAVILLLLLLLLLTGFYFSYTYYQDQKIIKAAAVTLDKEPTAVQIDSIKRIAQAFRKYGDGDRQKLAYILATARHESRFEPKKEYRESQFSPRRANQDRYWLTGYYGRGFVQLTWESNYKKMSEFIGVDLVGDPDKALNPTYAARILVYGMIEGKFGIKKPLSYYINNGTADYINARRTVNGTDKAALIADYAIEIEKELNKW